MVLRKFYDPTYQGSTRRGEEAHNGKSRKKFPINNLPCLVEGAKRKEIYSTCPPRVLNGHIGKRHKTLVVGLVLAAALVAPTM